MKRGKSGPGKNYYFLLSNNQSIQAGPQLQQQVESKDDWTTRKTSN